MRYMLLFMVIGVACANMVLNTAQPEIETSLALQQFENPSVVTDTVYRNYYGTLQFILNCFAILCMSLYVWLTFFNKNSLRNEE